MLQYNIDLNGKTILVTGAAGFIGSNLVKRLLSDFEQIKVIRRDDPVEVPASVPMVTPKFTAKVADYIHMILHFL